MVWNVVGEFVSPNNITISPDNPSGIVNAAFHSSPSFIYTLLYPHLKSIFVNTFFVPMFSTIFKIKDKG